MEFDLKTLTETTLDWGPRVAGAIVLFIVGWLFAGWAYRVRSARST